MCMVTGECVGRRKRMHIMPLGSADWPKCVGGPDGGHGLGNSALANHLTA